MADIPAKVYLPLMAVMLGVTLYVAATIIPRSTATVATAAIPSADDQLHEALKSAARELVKATGAFQECRKNSAALRTACRSSTTFAKRLS